MNFLIANLEVLILGIIAIYFVSFFVSLDKKVYNKKRFFKIFIVVLLGITGIYSYLNIKINYDEINNLENIKNGNIYKNNENLRNLFQEFLIDNKITKSEYSQIIELELNIMTDNLNNYYENKIQKMKKD